MRSRASHPQGAHAPVDQVRGRSRDRGVEAAVFRQQHPAGAAAHAARRSSPEIERIPDARVRARWRKAATGGISADDLKPSIARLTGMAERIDRALQESPWLAGDEYSLADIDIAPFVQRLVRIDLFGLVAARPRVNDWYARMTSRPAYASAMPPAGSEGGQPASA